MIVVSPHFDDAVFGCGALLAGHPCARVQRHAFDLAGHCIEWRTTRGDANAFHYTVSIT